MKTSRIYIYDGTGLTDGTNVQQLNVPIVEPGKRFSLRRIVGVNRVASTLQLYYPGTTRPVFSAPAQLGNQILISPAMEWDGNRNITFDLGTVARSVTACGGFPIYKSHIGFQGVVLDNEPAIAIPDMAVPYSIRYSLTVDWYRYVDLVGGAPNNPRTFWLQMGYGDFALTGIQISKAGAPLTTDDFYIRLYDAQQTGLSNAPVPQSFYNGASSLRSPFWAPVIYRNSQRISFDVQSMICNLDGAMPKTYELTFSGLLWRS